MGLLRVYSSDGEKIDNALELLKPLGVEVLTSETPDQEELILFYMSRMNNKLDNLGQLRHLVKLERTLSELRKIVGAANEREMKELGAKYRFNRRLYETLVERTKFDPKIDKYDLAYLTIDQINAMFTQGVSFE